MGQDTDRQVQNMVEFIREGIAPVDEAPQLPGGSWEKLQLTTAQRITLAGYRMADLVLATAAVAETLVSAAILANFNEDRSGDIYVVFDPQWFVAEFDGMTVTGSHGQPWTYDSHVPIIWMGPGIEPGRIARRVETVDVAPTISAYLGVKYPSGSRGRVMTEITARK